MDHKEYENPELIKQKARINRLVSRICAGIAVVLFGIEFVVISNELVSNESSLLADIVFAYIFPMVSIFFGAALLFTYLSRSAMSRYRKITADRMIEQYPSVYNENIGRHTQEPVSNLNFDGGIRVSTFCTYEVFEKFYHFSLLKSKYHDTLKSFIAIGMPVLILFLFMFSLSEIATFLTILFILCVYSYFKLPRQTYNAQMNMLYGSREFVFGNDEISIVSITPGYSFNSSHKYDNLYKIYETKDFIYVYITKYSAHIVRRADIFGRENELIQLLSSRLGNRYVKCV